MIHIFCKQNEWNLFVAYPIHYEVFQSHIQETKKENNSVVEVSKLGILVERQAQNFMFFKAKSIIEEKSRESLDADSDKFCAEVVCLYESCIGISKEKDSNKGRIFLLHVNGSEWYTTMAFCRTFSEVPEDQSEDIPEVYKDHEEFCNFLAHQKWLKYFEKSKNFPVFLRNPFTQCWSRTNFLTYQSAVDKRIKQS